MTSSPQMKFVARRSDDRGHADHGWLKTFHTFSFAMFQDKDHQQFGALRVLNEDRVAPQNGFGTHSHREFEIFSYIISGQIEHKDSMGNTEILKRGDIQLTSAGTGISHSEKAYGPAQVHLLQIWSFPTHPGLTPKYYNRHFSDTEKMDKWCKVVAPVGSEGVTDQREADGPTPVHSMLTMYATILEPGKGKQREMGVDLKGSKAYIHVIQKSGYNPGKASGGSVKVSSGDGEELVLREGDGAYIQVDRAGTAALEVENVGDRVAEVVLVDMD